MNTTQDTRLTAIEGVNATQNAAISTLQGQTATLFNLAETNRREISKANEGVAMALALDSPSLPSGTTYAFSGGLGYYNNQTAGTFAATVRVGENAALSAGVGVGFNSGEVGARVGFQIAR